MYNTSNHSSITKDQGQVGIEQQENKEFSILESDAVIDPRTMMVHI